MQSRQPGIDLLRCLGLLFVTGVHSFLYNGYYYEPQMGILMWGANSFKWLFFTCNGLFMLLTGYLKCEKPLSKGYYRSLLPILVGYGLTCLVSFPIRHFVLNEKLTLWQWLEKMVTFGNYAWYIEMYIGLILISPLINLALKQLTTPRQIYWAAGAMVAVSALHSITPLDLIPDYWSALYPLAYYVIGASIRKLQPKCRPGLFLTLAAGFTMWLGLLTLITTDGGASDGFGQGYGGFWVTVMVLLIFLTWYRVQLKPVAAKTAAWMAGGVFEGYILSRLLDVWIYGKFPLWHKPEFYPLILVVITVPVFLCSILMGKGTHALVELILKPLQKKAPVKSGKKGK
jgi:surface polysaccharide O-acyltransferase-like enzyme